MPIWSEILKKIMVNGQDIAHFHKVRNHYLKEAAKISGRPTIFYGTRFTQPAIGVPPDVLSITNEDIQGFMEVIHGLTGDNLDFIIHSPGGMVEAAEGIVEYLRTKFKNIRVIVPQFAKSAATMIACSANSIVMGNHSFLGPIDPQLLLTTPVGTRYVPALNILEQFQLAQSECSDPLKARAWVPMLGQYGPDLLISSRNVTQLSIDLVKKWLEKYMFEGLETDYGKTISNWLGDHGTFKSHGRHINREECIEKKLKVEKLEDSEPFRDAILSHFHATTITFDQTGIVKIIENDNGSAFIKAVQLGKQSKTNN